MRTWGGWEVLAGVLLAVAVQSLALGQATLQLPQAAPQLDRPLLPSSIPPAVSADPIYGYLRTKLDQQPQHSDTWRLLANLHFRNGDVAGAEAILHYALSLDPQNVAAHYDLARLLIQTERRQLAATCVQQVFQLGGETEYANELLELGWEDPSFSASTAQFRLNDQDAVIAQTASLSVKTFDGSEQLDREIERREADVTFTESRWRGFWETAVLYNSNVSLTPISRELADVDAGGFQASLSPDIEYIAWYRDRIRTGPLMRGLFNLNESQHSDFNLSSLQPGLFGEFDSQLLGHELISRVEYVHAVDFLAGDKLGHRDSLLLSTTAIGPDLGVYYGYILLAQTEFKDDGVDPAVTSLDGPSVTMGLSRFFPMNGRYLSMLTFGIDFEYADTEGSDYRYTSGSLHGGANIQFTRRLEWICNAGIGFRDYADFTGDPQRNELILRTASRFRFHWNLAWASDLVFGYDRFESENEDFQADRVQAGLATVWMY